MPPREEEQTNTKQRCSRHSEERIQTPKEKMGRKRIKREKRKRRRKKPLKDLINFELAQRKLEGNEEGFQAMSNKWLKIHIYKVKLNAEKYKERQKSYGLTYNVSMETEREPTECSQGEQGGQEKDQTQQNNSQD